MPEKSKMVVPTGFIQVIIKIGPLMPSDAMRFIPSFVMINAKGKAEALERRSVKVGSTEIFPLPPGEFTVFAELGVVTSPAQQVVVRAGEVTRVEIYFGK